MRMESRKFRIGELAKELNLEKFVIRFWEKEFNLNSFRSKGGQRFYESKDAEKFKTIKHLLYKQGFTIAGAKKALQEKSSQHFIPSQKIVNSTTNDKKYEELLEKFNDIKSQLVKLRELI